MIAARIPQSHDTWEIAAVSCRRSRQGFLALMLVLVYYVRSPEASKLALSVSVFIFKVVPW